jgi:carboxyl-terminal processing protease
LADLDSFEKVRTQKKLSLNLKSRVAEREQLEAARLARENARRAAHGQPAVAKLADLNGAEPPDAVLAETTQIAADLSTVSGAYFTKLKAENRSAPAP